jgi:hypothetical protein
MRSYGMTKIKAAAMTAAAAGLLLAAGVGALSANGAAKPPKPVAAVRADAAGVNEGTKDQAAGVQMRPIKPGDSAIVGKSGQYGGCTPGYGRGRECLPPASADGRPAGAPWTCVEVAALLPKGIRLNVKGVDPLGLDSNGDGIACGTGD